MKNVGKILTQILELFFPKLNSRRQNLISDITDNYLHAHPRDIFFSNLIFTAKNYIEVYRANKKNICCILIGTVVKLTENSTESISLLFELFGQMSV